jgi:hypothetical protein
MTPERPIVLAAHNTGAVRAPLAGATMEGFNDGLA